MSDDMDDYDNAAEALSDITGKPEGFFRPDDDVPDFTKQKLYDGGYVPIEALQELVEEWRELEDESSTGAEWALGKCADELQEVIEQYE